LADTDGDATLTLMRALVLGIVVIELPVLIGIGGGHHAGRIVETA